MLVSISSIKTTGIQNQILKKIEAISDKERVEVEPQLGYFTWAIMFYHVTRTPLNFSFEECLVSIVANVLSSLSVSSFVSLFSFSRNCAPFHQNSNTVHVS